MTRFVLLDRGEELGPSNAGALGSAPGPIRLKLLEPASPFRDGQIVQVVPLLAGAARPRDLLLVRDGGAFRLHALRDGPVRDTEQLLGRVVAIERGPSVFSIERGVLARVPAPWLGRAIDFLEVLSRLRHPFTPSLHLGSAETCLAGVREKYDRDVEVRQYSSLSPADLEALELEIVARYVKPGGRILDIGCGAGREALAFARAGFQVTGIDVAPRMIEAARQNAKREALAITFRMQSVTELDEPPGSFDAAYWASSYHHVPGRALRIEALGRIARALTADGALMLLVVYRAPRGLISRSRLVDVLRRVGARLGKAWRVSEPGDAYMREVSEASDPREPCFFHEFSGPDELRDELEAAALKADEVSPGWWVCRPSSPS